MYLKSIEVQGFKSFAHKIKFEFHNGITCIVGPNGSGKSNVSDAVRWVFGEQSAKQLRSTSMQDIIFAGTQLRKPQSFAEVTITLDNADRSISVDTDEVSVTRKVYRSGESEYRINGSLCRLKDVMETFYDTGIGKEGYSIIGQGQVDKILSGKAEERRELFDEACGIVKYKKRKAVALKKLESEHANMVRVTDILSELERQVGPLKRQSETAKEYLKLKEELRAYDINAFLLDRASIQKTLTKVENDLTVACGHLDEKEAEMADLKKNYVDVDDEIHTLEWKIEQARSRVNEAESERNQIEKQIEVSNEKLNSEETQKKHYSERISEIETEVSDSEDKKLSDSALLVTVLEETDTISKALSDKNREIDDKNAEISLYQSQVDESHQKVIGILNEKSEANAEFTRLEESVTQGESRIGEYKEERDTLSEKQEVLSKEAEDIKAEIISVQDGIDKDRAELSEVQTLLAEAGENFYKTQNDLTDLQQKYQIEKGRIESLKAIKERYEGFNPAVKRIMEQKNEEPSVCGTVSDLITVDRKYQTLIETALGGNFQNIIVEKETDAKRLVTYLKENKAGRATFLPLDAIKASGGITDSKILSENGVIGTADTLVKCDKKYQEAIRYLLERFLAVDNVDHALSIARKYRYTVRIVTLEGEFLNVGGSITGGAFKSGNSILSRNDELTALEASAEENRVKIEKAQKKLNQYKQVRDSYAVEAEDLSEAVHEKELQFAELKAKYDSLSRQLSVYELEFKEIERKLSETEEALKTSASRREALQNAVRNLENANSASADSADQVKALLDTAKSALEALLSEKEELVKQLTSLSEKKTYTEASIEECKNRISRGKEERTSLIEKSEFSDETVKQLKEEIEGLKESLLSFGDRDKGLGETLRLLTEEKDKLTTSQRSYFDKLNEINTTVSDLQTEKIRLENQQEKAEEKLSNLTEYLWTEYEMTPSEAEAYKDRGIEETVPSEIRRHTHELKTSIKNLGNVNVNAIDEYKEVSERYEFMKGQHDDLVKAEESLNGIVNDLNEGMRKQFTEQFELIKKEFGVVFSELFGGGTGSIELNPDVDCIESDIAVISQPPGKKLQNMMQLSGGEKAMTAIALIFAIQRLKPSPFCLLDEIEAALDDTNVVRFTNYVKTLIDKTQYIIITHRRGTMVAADRLYGITMQEKGVSALVSVNLVEKELDQ